MGSKARDGGLTWWYKRVVIPWRASVREGRAEAGVLQQGVSNQANGFKQGSCCTAGRVKGKRGGEEMVTSEEMRGEYNAGGKCNARFGVVNEEGKERAEGEREESGGIGRWERSRERE